MSGPDWFRWYPAKWASGVIGLTPEQRGVYMDIINIILDRGACPEDYGYLAKACNCRTPRVKRIVGELVDLGKIEVVSGEILQHKARTERENSEQFSELQRQRAHKRHASGKDSNVLAFAISGAANTTTITETKKEVVSQSHGPTEGELFGESESSPHTADSPKPATRRRAGRKQALEPELFNQLWQAQDLPNQKRAGAPAKEAWAKALGENHSASTIVREFGKHQGCWKRHGYPVDKIPYLSTWLNQRRWLDDLPPPRSDGQRTAREPEYGVIGVGSSW
jgi:hypothetical protein